MKTLKQQLQERLFPNYSRYNKNTKNGANRTLRIVLEVCEEYVEQKRSPQYAWYLDKGVSAFIKELLSDLNEDSPRKEGT